MFFFSCRFFLGYSSREKLSSFLEYANITVDGIKRRYDGNGIFLEFRDNGYSSSLVRDGIGIL